MAINYQNQLNKHQILEIKKNRKRQLGKYFAMWAENGHLKKYMVTLSPNTNTLDATIALRQNFFDKLSNKKKSGPKIAYYSAIEVKLNKNPPSKSAQITQQTRMKLMQKNFHIHIQILTDMKKSDLEKIVKQRLDPNLCTFYKITTPKKQGITYDYVVKDIKNTDWELQYILKTQYKSKTLYTSSRKGFPDYIITKLWDFMKKQYKSKWNKIGDKYSFVLNLKKNGDLLLSNTSNIGSNLSGVNLNLYDVIHIKNKNTNTVIYIYVKKNIL